MNVLALSGSLRAASINSMLLRAVAKIAPADICVSLYSGLGELPLFNPDIEAAPGPQVLHFQAAVDAADALVIASPEYAHGVSGTIKNALDWLVSHVPFGDKPVAVFNASPRAHHADTALKETLRTMSAVIVAPACIALPLLGADWQEDSLVKNAAFEHAILGALRDLQGAVSSRNATAAR